MDDPPLKRKFDGGTAGAKKAPKLGSNAGSGGGKTASQISQEEEPSPRHFLHINSPRWCEHIQASQNMLLHTSQNTMQSEHKISVLPVLDNSEQYLGCTSVFRLMNLIANTASIKEVGGIVVLEMNQIDYSLAQIAQIVESENAKILSSFIMTSSDSTKIEVTLKISEIDLSRIIRSFERYDMVVKASFQRSKDDDDLQFRYDALINYLNI